MERASHAFLRQTSEAAAAAAAAAAAVTGENKDDEDRRSGGRGGHASESNGREETLGQLQEEAGQGQEAGKRVVREH